MVPPVQKAKFSAAAHLQGKAADWPTSEAEFFIVIGFIGKGSVGRRTGTLLRVKRRTTPIYFGPAVASEIERNAFNVTIPVWRLMCSTKSLKNRRRPLPVQKKYTDTGSSRLNSFVGTMNSLTPVCSQSLPQKRSPPPLSTFI